MKWNEIEIPKNILGKYSNCATSKNKVLKYKIL